MAYEQAQIFCERCRRPTLHARQTYDVPHTLHLLVTLLLCGFWLPVWILHAVINEWFSKPQFLCQHCGQPAAKPSWSTGSVAMLLCLVIAVLIGLLIAGSNSAGNLPAR